MVRLVRKRGISAALLSAGFLGVLPILAKQAYAGGFSPLAVVTLRTGIAAALLLLVLLLFDRKAFSIYSIGLVGCILAGAINGVGSILYYTGLQRLDASLSQLLYSFYPLFMTVWLLIDRQRINPTTILRLLIAMPGVYLLLTTGQKNVDLVGAGLVLGSSLLYALHIVINQRILYDVPPQTVTLYTLLAMGVTVFAAYLIFEPSPESLLRVSRPVIWMGLLTFLSRIALFTGVKHLGSLQTSIVGIAEVLVSVIAAHFWLGEQLSSWQWVGAGFMIASLLLIIVDTKPAEKYHAGRWLAWLTPG